MDNFTFYSPTCFVFGKEEEKNTGKLRSQGKYYVGGNDGAQ